MSSVTLNPGSGGATVATDVHGGDNYQLVKVAGNRAGLFPGYSGAPDTFPAPVLVDDDGSLMTRSAVLTDEGSYRINFANTSLAVAIGSVTIVGDTVTGTGFLAADVHSGDYFKLDADGESAWLQIDSIDSDTQLTLRSAYVGGSSGNASRAIMRPVTGTGGSIAVASGQCTIGGGTTINATTRVVRNVDYGPLVYRARTTISQRIANQTWRVGLSESFTTADRWFARFKIDGTTATTVICETGRNPTTAPSASETESTTVTIPNGLTTATALDYRVELLTERVLFFINDVQVASHTRVIPAQHDDMEGSVTCVNGGSAPASNTNAVVDFVTVKNHNKLEIGVMSDAEKIVASNAPVEMRTFSQAGVITINTDLFIVDCAQFRSLGITCTSMGSGGVVTVFWTNDLSVTGQAGQLSLAQTTASGRINTFNAAGTWSTPVFARYARIRLTTATTTGTTSITLALFQQLLDDANRSVNAILNTVTTSTGLSAGTNAIGDVGLQVRANATGAGSVSKIASAATTNATSVKASAGRVFGYHFTNTTAAIKIVRFYNLATAPTVGTSVPVYNVVIPANGYVFANFPQGRGHSTGIAYAITNAIADLDATAVAANDVIGAIDFA